MISDKIKSICRYLRRSQYGYRKPELFINLTYSCPLRCKYCYVNYDRNRDFDLENLCYLFEEGILKTSYIKAITFFGGEPLLKIDLIEEVMKKYNISIYSMPYELMKQTFIHDKVTYAPSIIIINKGNIVTFLDPEKDDDLNKYQDANEFEKWLGEYIYLNKEK